MADRIPVPAPVEADPPQWPCCEHCGDGATQICDDGHDSPCYQCQDWD